MNHPSTGTAEKEIIILYYPLLVKTHIGSVKMGMNKNKILKILIAPIFLILILAILLPKFPIVVVNRVFNYTVQNFVNISCLSPWPINGILVFALMPFY